MVEKKGYRRVNNYYGGEVASVTEVEVRMKRLQNVRQQVRVGVS